MKRTYLLACMSAMVLVCVTTMHAAQQPSCSRNRGDMRLRRLVAHALPATYAADPQWFEIASDLVPHGSLSVVCASPGPPPESTYTPPYVRLFLVSVLNGQARLLWSQELAPDNWCRALSLLRTKDGAVIISVISRPYAGSSARYHLRLFRYGMNRQSLECLLETGFTDGTSAPLRGVGGGSVAFFVCEPVEKEASAKYRGTIYSQTRDGRYNVKSRFVTQRPYTYGSIQSAYRELRRRFEKRLGPIYRWPDSLPNLD